MTLDSHVGLPTWPWTQNITNPCMNHDVMILLGDISLEQYDIITVYMIGQISSMWQWWGEVGASRVELQFESSVTFLIKYQIISTEWDAANKVLMCFCSFFFRRLLYIRKKGLLPFWVTNHLTTKKAKFTKVRYNPSERATFKSNQIKSNQKLYQDRKCNN